MSVKSEYAKRLREKRKLNHECTICGNKDHRTLSGKPVCYKCLENKRKYDAARLQKYKKEHICPDCSNKTELKPNGGYYKYCKKCRIKRSQKLYERKHSGTQAESNGSLEQED